MKDISELLNNDLIGRVKGNDAINQTLSEEAIDLVNELFLIFKANVSTFHLYAKTTEELDFLKNEWVICFQKAKLEKQDVLNGVNKIRNREVRLKYMISPADFIELCFEPIKDVVPQHLTMDWDGFREWDEQPEEEKARKREPGKDNIRAILDYLKK